MQLINLFIRNEAVAGLEVTDTFLRVALIGLAKKGKGKFNPKIRVLAEQPLEEGVVCGGEIKDEASFVKSLQLLIKESNINTKYLIVSISAERMYSKVFSFPKSVQGEKLEETMNLVSDFQLPLSRDAIYLDWEKISDTQQSEAFLVAGDKVIVDAYMNSFNLAGVYPVAIEFSPISLGRVFNNEDSDEATLVVSFSNNSSEISVFKRKFLYFYRNVPYEFFSKKTINHEIGRVKGFFESENNSKVTKETTADKLATDSLFADSLTEKEDHRWLVSLGAALRGLIPRSQDNLVSVMPVGTEEAYENRRAEVFSGFLVGITIGLCVFFSVVFLGIWIFMKDFKHKIEDKENNLVAISSQGEWAEIEEKAKKINQTVAVASNLIKIMPEWSVLADEVKSITSEDISVSELSLSSVNESGSIKGSAKNRASLNLFKKNLEESDFLKEVTMPLTNLEQKNDIPFTISFKLNNLENLLEN